MSFVQAAAASETEDKLKMQLSLERANYDRMMGQMIQLSNELNDRDEQIAVLKKKESHYEQTLLDRDNMFKQDAMVRMQLGKRLEQVLMDKEEALEQLEHMKVYSPDVCANIHHAYFYIIGASGAHSIHTQHQHLQLEVGSSRHSVCCFNALKCFLYNSSVFFFSR